MKPPPMDLRQFCAVAGITARTVHYYVQLGLLPSPGARGRGAKYDGRHLGRLRLISRLRVEGLSLGAIREELNGLSEAQLEQALEGSSGAGVPGGHPPTSTTSAPRTPHVQRSQWERLTLAPEVELYVRRPLSRERSRQVDRLLRAAHSLFAAQAATR